MGSTSPVWRRCGLQRRSNHQARAARRRVAAVSATTARPLFPASQSRQGQHAIARSYSSHGVVGGQRLRTSQSHCQRCWVGDGRRTRDSTSSEFKCLPATAVKAGATRWCHTAPQCLQQQQQQPGTCDTFEPDPLDHTVPFVFSSPGVCWGAGGGGCAGAEALRKRLTAPPCDPWFFSVAIQPRSSAMHTGAPRLWPANPTVLSTIATEQLHVMLRTVPHSPCKPLAPMLPVATHAPASRTLTRLPPQMRHD